MPLFNGLTAFITKAKISFPNAALPSVLTDFTGGDCFTSGGAVMPSPESGAHALADNLLNEPFIYMAKIEQSGSSHSSSQVVPVHTDKMQQLGLPALPGQQAIIGLAPDQPCLIATGHTETTQPFTLPSLSSQQSIPGSAQNQACWMAPVSEATNGLATQPLLTANTGIQFLLSA